MLRIVFSETVPVKLEAAKTKAITITIVLIAPFVLLLLLSLKIRLDFIFSQVLGLFRGPSTLRPSDKLKTGKLSTSMFRTSKGWFGDNYQQLFDEF